MDNAQRLASPVILFTVLGTSSRHTISVYWQSDLDPRTRELKSCGDKVGGAKLDPAWCI